MVEVTKAYIFDGENGKASLLDLFEGRRQVVLYHFMFAPSVGVGRRLVAKAVPGMPTTWEI